LEEFILKGFDEEEDDVWPSTSGLSDIEKSILRDLKRNVWEREQRTWSFFGLKGGIYYKKEFRPHVRMSAIFNLKAQGKIWLGTNRSSREPDLGAGPSPDAPMDSGTSISFISVQG
jgi:hypothetical protein